MWDGVFHVKKNSSFYNFFMETDGLHNYTNPVLSIGLRSFFLINFIPYKTLNLVFKLLNHFVFHNTIHQTEGPSGNSQ